MKDERQVLRMSHWALSFGDYEPKREKAVRLYSKGWKGATASPLSDFESERCSTFLQGLTTDRFWLKSDSYSNEAPPPLGVFQAQSICAWFMDALDHERFRVMLDSIPPRDNYYVIRRPLDSDISDRLKDRNWMLCQSEYNEADEAILSIQELTPADDVWIKIMLES
jgi:hypothetical protein